jgi:hypothetical protein
VLPFNRSLYISMICNWCGSGVLSTSSWRFPLFPRRSSSLAASGSCGVRAEEHGVLFRLALALAVARKSLYSLTLFVCPSSSDELEDASDFAVSVSDELVCI